MDGENGEEPDDLPPPLVTDSEGEGSDEENDVAGTTEVPTVCQVSLCVRVILDCYFLAFYPYLFNAKPGLVLIEEFVHVRLHVCGVFCCCCF